MKPRTRRILAATLVLIIVFYGLPQTLAWWGSRKAHDGTHYEKGLTTVDRSFVEGIKLIRFTSYFPGFGKKCDDLVRVYLESYTADYYINWVLTKEHYVTEHEVVMADSAFRAKWRGDSLKAQYFREQDAGWLKKLDDVMKVEVPQQLCDSFCNKWKDVTAVLRELNEKNYQPEEPCK